MKKVILGLFLFLLIPFGAKAEVVVNLFYGDTCGFCHQERLYLDSLERQFGDNIRINEYEVWNNSSNNNLMLKVRDKLNDKGDGVPYTVIGNMTFTGISEEIKDEIRTTILDNLKYPKVDIVSYIKNGEDIPSDLTLDEDRVLDLPVLGEVNLDETSPWLLSFAMGVMDAFNPCSIWIIVVLLGLLLAVYDKKKRFRLGLAFVITSSLIYLIFMLTNVNMVIGEVPLMVLRFGVSVVLIISGALFIDSFMKFEKKDKSYLGRLQALTDKKEMPIFVIIMAALAMVISTVQIAGSGGMPVLFEVMADINGLSGVTYALAIFNYIISFFLIGLALMFIMTKLIDRLVMNTTLRAYSRIIGGVLILLAVAFLIFFPEVLRFVA